MEVNRLRRRAGAEPLTELRPGRLGSSDTCPLQRSLCDVPGYESCRVNKFTVEVGRWGKVVHCSMTVFVFTFLFDVGFIRELDLRRIELRQQREKEQKELAGMKTAHDHELRG